MMYLNRAHIFSWYLSYAKMVNYLIILQVLLHSRRNEQSEFQLHLLSFFFLNLFLFFRIIMKQLFEAVEDIHNKSIVHRDLKPENILLDDNLNIKLTDFGFARLISPQERLFDLCGTPGYLAPELLRASMYENAEGYGIEVDLWACGVIMYTLLVGFPPFWHRKQMIMLRNIMEGKYEFCSPEWDDITEEAKDLVSFVLFHVCFCVVSYCCLCSDP